MMITSASGFRGILNHDMSLCQLAEFANNFAELSDSTEFLLARDTRNTGDAIRRAITGALVSRGATVVDFGVVSTPALFRESLVRKKPAIMITASHNEPEFNGLKFIDKGMGIGSERFHRVVDGHKRAAQPFQPGSVKKQSRTSYNDDLIARFGSSSCDGVKVALDLGGGAAIGHAASILSGLGCEVVSVNDSPGVFNRKMDPIADNLALLQRMVKTRRCMIGLGFDCDGDRLAIIDSEGKKRSGDFMLTLALSVALADSDDKRLVVSLDTTQAVDELAKKLGGEVFRSKVGEANVVGLMEERGVRFGGEGSSGGYIDGSFNHCRDSMLAALTIIGALKNRGPKLYGEVKSYQQTRLAIRLPRAKALRAIKVMALRQKSVDTTDGLKLRLNRKSWVLIRPSGTEDLVRVSAEADTKSEADRVAESYAKKLKELTKAAR